MAPGSDLYPLHSMGLYEALWGSMGLCRALWGSTVGLINPGHDLVTNSTHLSPASRPSPDMVRACIDLMKYNFCLFLACFQFPQNLPLGKWESEVQGLYRFTKKGQKCQFLNSSLLKEHCCRILSENHLLICLSYFGGHHLL